MGQLVNGSTIIVRIFEGFLPCGFHQKFDTGKDYQIFGESHIEEILQKYGLLLLNRLPIDPTIANLCDKGDIESIEKTNLEDVSLPE